MNRLATAHLTWLLPLCGMLLLLAGCSDDFELPGAGQDTPTTEISGTVTATTDFAITRPGGVASLTSFLFGPAHAAVTGLTPVVGATVELVRLGDGAVIDTTTSGGGGVYTFDEAPVLGSTVAYMVRVQGEGATMRALVSGGFVDISPASEVVAAAVLDGPLSFGNFELQEVAALNGLLASIDVDVSNLDFAAAVEAIRTAAGSILPDMVAGFSTPGAATTLRGSDYSIINYSALLRDPLVVPVEGAPGGVDIRSGQGMMIFGFGNSDAPTFGLLSEGAFLHDFSAVEAPGAENDDAFPFLSDLTDLLHVPNEHGQLLVADRRRPSASVAGIGAVSESGDYLVYPLDAGVLVEGDPSIFIMGLRYGARWRSDGAAQAPVLDLTLLDEAGGAGTIYNHMRLQQTLDGPDAGSSGVRLATEVGTVTFDSTPQTEDFSGQPADFGSFEISTLTDSLRLDLSSYSIDADNGSAGREGFYFIPAGGGLVQFRDDVGGMLGWGATSSDGLRDGEILGGQMFSGGFDVPVISAERSFSIAIRRAADMTAAALTGTYNLVEYGGYLANDVDAEPPRGYVETGIRYGTVNLDGLGVIASSPLVHKVARIDVAAALGETGTVPNASGESGAFTTATAGEAGETFSLTVGGTPVFVSEGLDDEVTAEDIQEAIDIVAPTSLAADGIEVSGSVIDGDLTFVRSTGEPFDIAVVNDFTGTAPASGGFGEGFAGRVENGSVVEANASGSSGVFTTLTAGADGEQFSLVVGGVTVFEVTSEALDDTVEAAELQAEVDASGAALAAEGIEVGGGTVAGGDLVFTKADGTVFTIAVTNTFSGIEGAVGGFAEGDFAVGTHEIDNGAEEIPAVATETGPSGGFEDAVATAAGQTWSMTVGGVTAFSFTSDAAGFTVTAQAIQDQIATNLANTEIEFDGSAVTGDLVFSKADGTAFDIVVVNEFTGEAVPGGGFAGALAAGGEIDNGADEVPAVATTTTPSGAFTDAVATAAGQTWSMTVGGVTAFTFTSDAAGYTVTAPEVQDQVALNLASTEIAFDGSAVGGDLVFSKADGSDFDITVVNDFTGNIVPGGGFTGGLLAVGVHEIDDGTEEVLAVATESGASGVFTTLTAGAEGQLFSLEVGGVVVFQFTSGALGDTVEPAELQAGIDASEAALADERIEVSNGTVAGGDLVFAKTDGTAFTIQVTNQFPGSPGGFAGSDFQDGSNPITGGTEFKAAVPNASGASGAFTTLTAGADGEQFSLEVDGVTAFEATSGGLGDTIKAAELETAIDAVEIDGVDVSGTVAGGDLAFTRADGAAFTIVVTNTFSGVAGAVGGFAGPDFQSGNRTITGGTLFAAAEPNVSGPSGAFTALTAGAVGERLTIVIDGMTVLDVASGGAGERIEAPVVQAMINGVVLPEGIALSGTVEGGDIVFTRGDGAAFVIQVTNTFSGIAGAAGGFTGPDFQSGNRTITGGTEFEAAEPNESGVSGPFAEAVASTSDQIWSMTVGGVEVFSFSSEGAGDTVTAEDIQRAVVAAEGALAAAEIESSGSAVAGDLVFSKADGTDFDIVVVNDFTGDAVPGGGFAGDDFAAGTREIDNGVESAVNESAPSGEFVTGLAGDAGEAWSMTVGDVEVFTFTSSAEGDTVTAADVQAGIESSSTALNDAGITFSGTATGGDLRFIRDDGAPFDIVIASSLSGRVSAAGGFAGEDFAAGERTIDNGSVAGAVPSLAASSEVQGLASGAYSVSPEGVVTLTLDIGGETIAGDGAVTQDGDFVAVVTGSGSANADGSRMGRSILFLIRQPD